MSPKRNSKDTDCCERAFPTTTVLCILVPIAFLVYLFLVNCTCATHCLRGNTTNTTEANTTYSNNTSGINPSNSSNNSF